jgi:multidrug efflux pump subunit AcrA (membrane-fusion protein)
VKTGRTIGDEVEILAGLASGESVVVGGAALLTDGQPVEAK